MRRFSETDLAAALDGLYAASFDPSALQSSLHALALAAGAEGAMLIQVDAGGFGCVGSPGIAEPASHFARGDWITRNYRFERSARLTAQGALITESMLCTPDELDREPLQNELLGKFGFKWWGGARLAMDDAGGMFLSIERLIRQDPFDGADFASLNRALPHLRRAGAAALSLGRAFEQGFLDGIEHVRRPALLLDAQGHIVAMNDLAGAAYSNLFRLRDRRFSAIDPTSDAQLQRAMNALATASLAPLQEVSTDIPMTGADGSHVLAQLSPVRGALAASVRQPRILVTIRPGTAPDPKSTALKRTYGLTPTEIRIALAVADGLSIRQITERQGVTVETIRTHLKSIFAKMNVRRQLDVAIIVHKLV